MKDGGNTDNLWVRIVPLDLLRETVSTELLPFFISHLGRRHDLFPMIGQSGQIQVHGTWPLNVQATTILPSELQTQEWGTIYLGDWDL
jgi:hypothetical protein